jgi:aminoglycoside phosphotransferase (APT) family kinase protein
VAVDPIVRSPCSSVQNRSFVHSDQLRIDRALVRGLVDDQFPEWAGLGLSRVVSTGTENAMYRLGADLAVRLPLRPTKAEQVRKERRWLPSLARSLPLPIPVPVGHGEPSRQYPSPWTVCRWLPGTDAVAPGPADLDETARRLAAFVLALRAVDTADGPAPGPHNFWRGVALSERDEQTRAALVQCEGLIDTDAAAQRWERDLAAAVHSGDPVWVHGDLTPANLLLENGRLTAVIDWGGLGVGDPAADLLPAWNLFTGASRRTFRAAVGADDDQWARARGLALSVALVALPYYLNTNAAMARWARDVIREVLAVGS